MMFSAKLFDEVTEVYLGSSPQLEGRTVRVLRLL
jgi:hypothetical protein